MTRISVNSNTVISHLKDLLRPYAHRSNHPYSNLKCCVVEYLITLKSVQTLPSRISLPLKSSQTLAVGCKDFNYP